METPRNHVIADFEAGIGTLTRVEPGAVDAVVIVVEATPKSMDVAVRAFKLATDKQIERVIVVANRVREQADVDTIRELLPGAEIVVAPDDKAIVDADRAGVAPLDFAPDAPAVVALAGIVDLLLGPVTAP